MNRAVLLMEIVVLLLAHSSTPDFNEGWAEYMQDEVELDNADLKKGYTPNFLQNRYSEGLPTALYDVPKSWNLHNDVPFAAVLYTADFQYNLDYSCGGALLTTHVVMSLCACVASYLNWVHGARSKYERAPFATKEDLGQDIYVKINFGRLTDKWSDDRWHEELFDHSNLLVERRSGEQLQNERCMEVFKDATAKFPKNWEQRTNIALLKMRSDHKVNYTYDPFVPWPPVPLTYDMTLKDKLNYESNLWGLHQSRAVETVSISSLNFKLQHAHRQIWYDHYGTPIIPANNRLKFRATLCDQDFCANGSYPPIDFNVAVEIRKRITCFCDENGRDTLCGGQVGTPVMHEGVLHGLLACRIRCYDKSPRDILVVAFDGPTIDWITTIVPQLKDRVLESINVSQFREDGILGNYEIYIPQADLLPSDDVFNKEIEIPPKAKSFAIPIPTSLDIQVFLQLFCTVQIFISRMFWRY